MARQRTSGKGRKAARTPGPQKPLDVVVALDANLDMRSARALQARLLVCLEGQGPCRIDASKVERISTGCLQVLAAFAVSMASAQRPVSVHQPSSIFADAAGALGLSVIFPKFNMEA